MSRLPIPGSDDNVWGTILNDYLSVSLNADGTVNPDAITSKANDNSVVHLANNETITGVKTFDQGTFQDGGSQVFNVKAFGAVGDGVTDDTTAIQDTINAAHNVGGAVYLPAATYIVSAPITLYEGIWLTGAGNGFSIIQLKSSASVSAILTLPTSQFNYSVTISDVQINGNSSGSATATNGIYFFAGSDSIIQRVRVVNVSGNAICLDGSGTYLGTANKVLDSFVRTCGTGLVVTSYSTDTLVEGCDFGSCTNQAYYCGASNLAMVGSIGWGSLLGFGIDTTASEVWVSGCRFDANETNGLLIAGNNVTVSGSLIYDNSHASSGFYPGIEVTSTGANTLITGTRSVGGLNGGSQHSWGLQLDSGRSGPATVVGCDFTGNGSGSINYNTASGDLIFNVNGYTSVLPVSSGGSGVGTISGLVKGNGTSAFTAAVGGTDYIAPDGTGKPIFSQFSASATAEPNGAPPSQVQGYLEINIGGSTYKVPYYNS